MKKIRNLLIAAGVITMVACNDTANDKADNDGSVGSETRDTANTAGTLAEKDAQFLNEVAESNMKEIKLSQLAQTKATAADVKDIAKMLETDHSAVLSDVKNFASNRSVTLKTEDTHDATEHKNLDEKTGKEFDKDWCKHMIDMHEKSIKKFENAQNDLNDADLKAWAGTTLPKLRTHLERLQDCEKKLK